MLLYRLQLYILNKLKFKRTNLQFLFLVAIIALISFKIDAQITYKYLIKFTDKNNSGYTVSNPDAFLSQRAINRRISQNIKINETDLPVNKNYIANIKNYDVNVLYPLKWLNAVVIETSDNTVISEIAGLSFVDNIELLSVSQQLKTLNNKFNLEQEQSLLTSAPVNGYGYSYNQINLHNGDWLHNEGFLGDGIQIAVIDAGFYNADIIPAFDSLWINNRILGYKDFVNPVSDIFNTHSHGTNVLSIIGANVPNEYLGTAPRANFWLLRTEDASSEFRIEEANWIAAAEFADSTGVDVINTSLGYSVFDDSSQDYDYEDMTGDSTYISRAAEIAASKGMLLVISAGNEGNDPWKYITAPADANNILTIGAINTGGEIASFSSIGPSYDGRIKPDIVSVGWSTALVSTSGEFVYGNGTSFSAPMMTGLVSCLWQAFPEMKNSQIIDAVRYSSDRYNNPDYLYGYGIPDFKIAYEYLQNLSLPSETFSAYLKYTNWGNFVEVTLTDLETPSIKFDVYDINGRLKHTEEITSVTNILQYKLDFLENYPLGIYFVKIQQSENSKIVKVIR